MKKTISAAMAAAVMAATSMAATGATAQTRDGDTVPNPRGTLQNFDAENLGPLLSELGLVWRAQQGANGQTYMSANVGGDFVINLIPSACLDNGVANCIGLNTIAMFTGGSANAQTVSAYNQKYWFVSAGVVSDGSGAYVSRYDIADFGIARGNVASSLRNFIYLAAKFRDELKSGAKTVSADGYIDDVASPLLNLRGVKALKSGRDVKTAAHVSAFEGHAMSLEEAPEIVKVFLADPETPKNKISNFSSK
ncbi:MAG: hypothetical protein AAGC56_13980 [Pseudomonadota bacterium]